MPSRTAVCTGAALVSLCTLCALPPAVHWENAPPRPLPVASDFAAQNFERLPLAFERNVGQTDGQVAFLSRSRGGTLFLAPTEAVFDLTDRALPLRMELAGANKTAPPIASGLLPGRVNYLLGRSPAAWKTNLPTYGRAGFRGVYPGVAVVYYGNRERLEYDFVVQPHAAPESIALRFAGAKRAAVAPNGDLVLTMPDGPLRWQRPTVYQERQGQRREIACRYRVETNHTGGPVVRFAPGPYDTEQPLVIDPALLYSTFLGGGGGDSGNGVAVDTSGNAYITGSSHSTNLPTTTGAYQRTNKAGRLGSAFVSKLSADGKSLLYSTYFGGTGHGGGGDYGAAIAVDASGSAYITGAAHSTNFPVTNGAYQAVNRAAANNAENAFVAKLDANGGLVYSTYLGGSGLTGTTTGDIAAGIALDGTGSAYITGSAFSTDFPTTVGAFQTTHPGAATSNNAAFVSKLSADGKSLLYSTYLGGSGGDSAYGIAVSSAGNAYVTGSAFSTNFPTTALAYQRSLGVNSFGAAFITKLSADGKSLVYSTYLGGNDQSQDYGAGIALDGAGNAYVTGLAGSANFPVTSAAYQRINRGSGTNSAFLTKLSANGSSLVYSTFLGGHGADYASAVAVDSAGNTCIVGTALSLDFPTTLGSYQRAKGDGTNLSSNAFVAKFNPSGATLLYSTLLSGMKDDIALAVALDSGGNAVVTGNAGSPTFPLTPGAYQPVNRGGGSGGNAFLTRLPMLPFTADVNHDGWNDLIFQNASSGQVNVWYMQGATMIGGDAFSMVPQPSYLVVGMGDFAGNGTNTLVFQSTKNNQIALWYTAGNIITGGDSVVQIPAPGYRIVAVADMNGDGKPDLIFQNQTTNQVSIWYMNGITFAGGDLLAYIPPAGWHVVGTGDLNADGKADLVFQNATTGQISVWFMNGTIYLGGALVMTNPAPGWRIVGVADCDGDGKADLIFQNQTTNQIVIWYMNGTTNIGGSLVNSAPAAGWNLVAPR